MSGVNVDTGSFDVTGAVAILVMGVGFVALFLDYGWWWMVFVLGWMVVVPLVGMFTDAVSFGDVDHERSAATQDAEDEKADEDAALATLRERYARGELTEAEFERKVERLVETESPEDAGRSGRDRGDRRGEREPERE